MSHAPLPGSFRVAKKITIGAGAASTKKRTVASSVTAATMQGFITQEGPVTTGRAVDGAREPQSYDSPPTPPQAPPYGKKPALSSTTPQPLLSPQPPPEHTGKTPAGHPTQHVLDEHAPESYAEGLLIVYAQAVPTAPTVAECPTPDTGEAPPSLLLDRYGRPRTWDASTGQWTYDVTTAPALYGAPAPPMANAATGYTLYGPFQHQPPPHQFFSYVKPSVGSYYALGPYAAALPPWLVAPPVWSVLPGVSCSPCCGCLTGFVLRLWACR
ncbi:unnamed protein product [Laminaria digitata]